MKILLISDPSNPHTIKWANSLSKAGIEIFLFGLSKYVENDYNENIQIESLKTPSGIKARLSGNILKGVYLTSIPKLKKICKMFRPDLIHAHYAGSYGLIASLINYHPFILSVWGIDISIYPKTSILHKKIIQYVLGKADYILATSNALREETLNYTDKKITVTPFGIDVEKFKPAEKGKKNDEIVIGTVKRLEKKYGIEKLLKVFAVLKEKHVKPKLKLVLVGEGTLRSTLEKLAEKLGISDETSFVGSVSSNKVNEYHNRMDIEVYLSKTESFGVSVLEAQACAKPVVVNNVGGLPEVIVNGKTGFTVSPGDTNETVEALERLIFDKKLRTKMGTNGRENVINNFNWENSVGGMIDIYKSVVAENESKAS